MRCAGDVPGGFGGVDDACAAVFSASFWKGDDAALLRLLGVAGDGRGTVSYTHLTLPTSDLV